MTHKTPQYVINAFTSIDGYNPITLIINQIYPIMPFKGVIKVYHHDDIQYLFNFSSGYGTSIIKNKFSYGNEQNKYELAILFNCQLIYTTPITHDVIGYLTLRDAFYITAIVSKFTKQPNNPHIRKSRLGKQLKKFQNN